MHKNTNFTGQPNNKRAKRVKKTTLAIDRAYIDFVAFMKNPNKGWQRVRGLLFSKTNTNTVLSVFGDGVLTIFRV